MPILDILHVTQNKNILRNDCSQATIAQWVRTFTNVQPTAERVAHETNTADHLPKLLETARGIASHYCLKTERSDNATLEWHKAQIDAGRPTMPLVDYRHIGNGNFPHFLSVIGYANGMIYVNDPLRDEGRTPVPEMAFHKAISTVSPGNSKANLAITPTNVSFDVQKVLAQIDGIAGLLNIRAAPSLNGTIIGRLSNRAYVEELSQATDTAGVTWLQIRTATLYGWICVHGHGIQLWKREAYV